MEINNIEKKILLFIARSSIEKRLHRDTETVSKILEMSISKFSPNSQEKYPILYSKSGCFVTLHIHKELRGCIGTFRTDRELYINVWDMAIQAAFHDPRFPPLTNDEFSILNIEISVLSPMVKIDNLDNIIIGRDGLYVKKGFHSGVLLPQVATEYGWDKGEFLSYTCRKAGLKPDIWKYEAIEIYKFSASVFSEEDLS